MTHFTKCYFISQELFPVILHPMPVPILFLKVAISLGWILSIFCNETHISIYIRVVCWHYNKAELSKFFNVFDGPCQKLQCFDGRSESEHKSC